MSELAELPNGWAWATLEEIASWGSGGTPKSGQSNYYDGDLPWAIIGDLTDGLVTKTANSITPDGLANSSAKFVPDNSVLIAMYGSIGKLGLPTVPLATNQAIAFAVPRQGCVDRKFLFWFLMHSRPELVRAGKGGAQQNISQTLLKAWPIPLPPLAEQHRIVEALEEQLSRLDTGSELINSANSRVEALMKSLVASLIEPYFESDSIDDYTTELARLSNGAKHSKAPAYEHTLPSGWTTLSVGQLSSRIQYGTSAKTHPRVVESDVAVLRMGNIQRGAVNPEKLKFLPSDEISITGLLLEDGELLFNRTNSAELVGKSALYRGEPVTSTFASYLIRCKFHSLVNADWVNTVINSSLGRTYISSVASQQVGQANVNGTKLAQMPIPIPPRAVQDRLMKKHAEDLGALNSLQASLAKARSRASTIRGKLLESAFAGTLVNQDPTEEPASILLERIAAERDNAKPAVRRRASVKAKA